METRVADLSGLETEAARFIRSLAPTTGATLVTLSGELGAGKTAFAKAAAKALGVTETVTSPTFVLEKIYKLPTDLQFSRLVHIDAYRLEEGSELGALGFDELMKDRGNLVVLEWPEKVDSALPVPSVRIAIAPQDDGSRIISYN